jgi:hypothetical protein
MVSIHELLQALFTCESSHRTSPKDTMFAVVDLIPLSNNQKTKTTEALESVCTQAQVLTFF